MNEGEPVGGGTGAHDLRIRERSTQVAVGTLACPACDAPVLPGPGPMHPADALACPLCPQTGRVRDFLSLTTPTRPARVVVRVVTPGIEPRAPRTAPRQ
jgi:hypothetical protein